MTGSWVAASVRARGMARGRAGAGSARTIAAGAPAAAVVAGTVYHDIDGDAPADRAIPAVVLWQLRVLGGWLPPGGAALLRAVVAVFERSDIVDLARRLSAAGDPRPAIEPYRLGGLTTAWRRAAGATTAEELRDTLAASAWGDPGTTDPVGVADALAVAGWRRLAAIAPVARPWARRAAALLLARRVVVEPAMPDVRLTALLRPLVGEGWTRADDLDSLVAGLPPSAVRDLAGIAAAEDIWRAEAAFVSDLEADAERLLRASRPGPEVVLAASALLLIDAWRLRAAFAAAATGGSDVLDVVA